MKYLLVLIALFVTTTVVAQITGTAEYRYYYNSEVIFYETKTSPSGKEYEQKTVAGQDANTIIGVSVNIPFSVFEESPIWSERFSLDAGAYLQADHIVKRIVQHYYNFGLNFKPILNENFHVTTKINIAEPFNDPRTTVADGYDFKVGLSYNVVDQAFPNIFNFYAELNYIVFSEYNTLFPYGNKVVNTYDIHNVIGIVINIKDFFFIEQNITTITESNLPKLTFSPYYSDYKTKFWVAYKMFNLGYEHVCFHPIESDNENPRISGVLNHVVLEFNF